MNSWPYKVCERCKFEYFFAASFTASSLFLSRTLKYHLIYCSRAEYSSFVPSLTTRLMDQASCRRVILSKRPSSRGGGNIGTTWPLRMTLWHDACQDGLGPHEVDLLISWPTGRLIHRVIDSSLSTPTLLLLPLLLPSLHPPFPDKCAVPKGLSYY